MASDSTAFTITHLIKWADLADFAAQAKDPAWSPSKNGIIATTEMPMPREGFTPPNGFRFPSAAMDPFRRAIYLLAIERYCGPDPTTCPAFEKARTYSVIQYGEELSGLTVRRIVRDFMRTRPMPLAEAEAMPLAVVMNCLEEKPDDGTPLRHFVDAVNDYVAFAVEATACGKTSKDQTTRNRSLALRKEMESRLPAALAAGFRAGQPELQMESTLKQCIDLCDAYANYWPHDSDKLLRELSKPLRSLEMLISASGTPTTPLATASRGGLTAASLAGLVDRANTEQLGIAFRDKHDRQGAGGLKGGDESKLKTEAVLPVLLSASDIARHISRNPKSVTSFLTRLAVRLPDCRIENESKRKTEPKYLYRTADVWPSLENWLKDDNNG
ncbi:MAG: hypothetical protein U0791_18450 [Gemmataceae bacterium]